MTMQATFAGLALAAIILGTPAAQASIPSSHPGLAPAAPTVPVIVAKNGVDNPPGDRGGHGNGGRGEGAHHSAITPASTIVLAHNGADDGAGHDAGEHHGGDNGGRHDGGEHGRGGDDHGKHR